MLLDSYTIIRIIIYMIYKTPKVSPAIAEKLTELDRLRAQLGGETARPSRLARNASTDKVKKAASVESSVSIEGYEVPERVAEAIVGAAERVDESDENRSAVACYARAMDHVGVMALDPIFKWMDRVILDLHFDACYFRRDKSPGHWRTGAIGVTGPRGDLVYEAPDGDQVIPLMAEVIDWLQGNGLDEHVAVRGAMAHLHVVSVHPFRDGNGRISRILQSLVLALDGILSPEFGSIEEYLGADTSAYYSVLQEVQGGRYQPERDATPWVAFCIDAHLAQARHRLEQIAVAAARWTELERLVEARRWPDRLVIALEQSLMGGTGRSSYESEADVSIRNRRGNDFRRRFSTPAWSSGGRGRVCDTKRATR